jgi:hypothetical protein
VLRFIVALLASLLGVNPILAHDVPSELRIHAFVKPEGERLDVLVRVPLALLLNLDLPKRGPGYLELSQLDEGLARAVAATAKDIEFLEDGRPLTLTRGRGRISLPSDRSFESFDSAIALIHGPRLPDAADVFWNQGYFDAHLEYRIASPHSSFAIDFHPAPGMRDRLKIELRYRTPEGSVRAYELQTGSGMVVLDPRWHQAAWSFVKSGFLHIPEGTDHLLFLICLILPFRRIDWALIGVITSFTVAHSITLIAAAFGFVPSAGWFPPLVEALIAASILYMAAENIVRPAIKHRWALAGLFGLVHGFGFSFTLASQLQFTGSHLLLSLLAFNLGIELGQLLVLALAVPVLALLAQSRTIEPRWIVIIISAVVLHTAWHWVGDRAEALRRAASWDLDTPAILAMVIGAVVLLLACSWSSESRIRSPSARRRLYDEHDGVPAVTRE